MPRVFAVGDPIIDENIECRATHIAPDAPVPVLVKDRCSLAPGGLWNAAGNLREAGAETFVFGVIGDDVDSFVIENAQFPGRAFSLVDPARTTQRKSRFLGQYHQQVLRVDIPKDGPISDHTARALVKSMVAIPPPDAILVSDYGCGVVTPRLMTLLRQTYTTIPIVVDPYPSAMPTTYFGADYLKLNRHEFEVLSYKLMGSILTSCVPNVIISNGAQPVQVLCRSGDSFEVQVPAREMVDACGAGDAFSGYLTWALASKIPFMEAVKIGAHAGACAVTRRGVYLVKPDEVHESMSDDPVLWAGGATA